MTANDGKPIELFVPGRLCLFGEHSDWAGRRGRHSGYCLVVGTDQGLCATVEASGRFFVETAMPTSPAQPAARTRTMSCEWEADALLEAAEDRDEFFRYCAGVARTLIDLPAVAGGIELRIDRMDLPLKKGVSSSAAVCVLVAAAFDRAYGLGLFPHEIMDLAYRGERLTGSRCGRMDQACIFGKTPVLLTFGSEDQVRVEPVFPVGPISMFLVDLAGRKDTVGILSDLQTAYADPANAALAEALGPENERVVRRAYRALAAGDAETLGGLMTEAQGIFDAKVAPHSAAQLASPRLHDVLALPALAECVHGGKGVGSQGDGTAQFVARSPDDRDVAMAAIERRFTDMRCFPLSIVPVGVSR